MVRGMTIAIIIVTGARDFGVRGEPAGIEVDVLRNEVIVTDTLTVDWPGDICDWDGIPGDEGSYSGRSVAIHLIFIPGAETIAEEMVLTQYSSYGVGYHPLKKPLAYGWVSIESTTRADI